MGRFSKRLSPNVKTFNSHSENQTENQKGSHWKSENRPTLVPTKYIPNIIVKNNNNNVGVSKIKKPTTSKGKMPICCWHLIVAYKTPSIYSVTKCGKFYNIYKQYPLYGGRHIKGLEEWDPDYSCVVLEFKRNLWSWFYSFSFSFSMEPLIWSWDWFFGFLTLWFPFIFIKKI